MADLTGDAALEQLSAYLDDELSPDERVEIETLLSASAEARATLGGLQRTVAIIHTLPDARLDDRESTRLDAAVLAAVASTAPPRSRGDAPVHTLGAGASGPDRDSGARRHRSPLPYFAAAAVIAAIVGFTIVLVADNVTDPEPPSAILEPTTSTSPDTTTTTVPGTDGGPNLADEEALSHFLQSEIVPVLDETSPSDVAAALATDLSGCTLPVGFEPLWVGRGTWKDTSAVFVAGRFDLGYESLVVAAFDPADCQVSAIGT